MAIDFHSPSQRAAGGSDLAISISPLGLVELADEEFEVHGPRLNRYAQNWAYYLGHHWGYRREHGEPQITFNYVKAFADFINNFTFSRSVQFRTPHATEHVVPALLKEVWEEHNEKEKVLWEIGQQGGVGGDVFVKVAYDPGQRQRTDELGNFYAEIPPRVRILPLNAAFCFPEWHPHDRDRLLRFKLKYRFYGNSPEGTRQVYTYTEIITDQVIEEYVNDELLDSRPNPLGLIPVVHIANGPVSGSPWGLSDIGDITPLNREYNEKATDISDIINYHAAPVTIITGAKASNLEKGPKKVWGGLPKDANVFNLANGVDLAGPMGYLDQLKRAMHEMTGVPETALGQMQPISNTSGVALAIQYQPMMNRYNIKKTQYSAGIKKLNEYVLRTLFTFEPGRLTYDASTQGLIEEDQLPVLDPSDPIIFSTTCHWPAPLPVDTLIKLNEIATKMQMGLESKRGALRDLGEEFADEKMLEIFEELQQDAKEQGALSLINAHIQAAIISMTGIDPSTGMAPEVATANGDGKSTTGSDSNNEEPGSTLPTGPSLTDVLGAEDIQKIQNELVTMAYGPRTATRRNPDNTDGS